MAQFAIYLGQGHYKRWCASDVCLSDVYLSRTSGLSREQRPRKTKIGTEVAHVTLDSGTTFKVKRSTCRGRGHIVRPPAQLVAVINVFTNFCLARMKA